MKFHNIASAMVCATSLANGNPIDRRGSDSADEAPTYAQIWCTIGVAGVGSLGALASGTAALLTYWNSKHTCAQQEGNVHDRRGADVFEYDAIAQHMHTFGYRAIDRSFLYDPSIASYGSGLAHFTNGDLDLIVGNHTDGGTIVTLGVKEPSHLGKRHPTTFRVQLHYNAYSQHWGSGVPCHTTATKDDFDTTAKAILNQINNQRCSVSCYRMYHGNDWHGSLRIGEYYNSEFHDSRRDCNGFGG